MGKDKEGLDLKEVAYVYSWKKLLIANQWEVEWKGCGGGQVVIPTHAGWEGVLGTVPSV
jgi:hypothetical protein